MNPTWNFMLIWPRRPSKSIYLISFITKRDWQIVSDNDERFPWRNIWVRFSMFSWRFLCKLWLNSITCSTIFSNLLWIKHTEPWKRSISKVEVNRCIRTVFSIHEFLQIIQNKNLLEILLHLLKFPVLKACKSEHWNLKDKVILEKFAS